MNTISRHELFWGTLPRKIHLARYIYEQYASELLTMPHIRQQLDLLAGRAAAVSLTMQIAGVPDMCVACAGESASGGCCGLAMADESDAILLLANLLAGNAVKVQREDGLECSFLGPNGCTLRFKPIFCLNYLCKRIRQTMTTEQQRRLDLDSGLLLQGQCRIEELLVAFLYSSDCLT